MQNYTSITIDKDTYKKLKEYCDKHAYSIAKLVKKLILEKINDKMPNM